MIPRVITEQIDAVLQNGQFDLLNVAAQVLDALVDVDRAVRIDGYQWLETILDDEEGRVVALSERGERIAQANRVNRPSPVRWPRCKDSGRSWASRVVSLLGRVCIGFDRGGHVVAEADVVPRPLAGISSSPSCQPMS